jgi:hypothetical protein
LGDAFGDAGFGLCDAALFAVRVGDRVAERSEGRTEEETTGSEREATERRERVDAEAAAARGMEAEAEADGSRRINTRMSMIDRAAIII